MGKNQKQKWEVGDLFLVPQSDGGYSLAQVLSYEHQALNKTVCAFTLERPDKEKAFLEIDPKQVISILFVTRERLDSGDWAVVGHAPVLNYQSIFDLDAQREKMYIGTKSYESGVVNEFLNACFGLAPWDDWYDPNFLDELLLSPEEKPFGIVFKDSIRN